LYRTVFSAVLLRFNNLLPPSFWGVFPDTIVKIVSKIPYYWK
jgi:hypothetical protein